MSRLALLLAAAAALAGCIDKPPRPSEREQPDGGGGDGGGTGCGAEPTGDVVLWSETDEIRFNQRVGLIDTDCRDDVVFPGSRAAGAVPGVFVVLGRESGFMDGYDLFLDTPGGAQPVELALSRLVGQDEILDLMVVASAGVDSVVLVYQGDGTGGFDLFAQKAVAGLELQTGTAKSPAPLSFFLAELEPDMLSLVVSDSQTTRIISPTDWDDEAAIVGAPVEIPAVFEQGATQELGVVGAADRAVDDLFDMETTKGQWFANQDGPADFAAGDPESPGIEGPGPSVFLDMDGDGDLDVTSVRFESVATTEFHLETLVLEPGAAGDPGTIDDIAQLPELIGTDTTFSDFALTDLGGEGTPEAILVEPRFTDGTRLTVYPDVAVSDGSLAAGDPIVEVYEHALGDADPDRLLIGRFREGVSEIRVVSSAPFLERGMCRVVTSELALEACP